MGLKFLYYVDTSANWILFTLGIVCVPFGVGGILLTTPITKKNVFPPWFHGTGIWVGMVFLSISMMMPFARFNSTFLRLAIALNFIAMMIAAVGLGVAIDEFINWFENPSVKTFGSDIVASENEVYVSQAAQTIVNSFKEFDNFHKGRVLVVMSGTLLGICMMLFRIVTLGLVIFDEFTTKGYDVYTPEEEMMNQAMEERDNQMTSPDFGDEDDTKYQPMLYATGKQGGKISKLAVLNEEESVDDESYYEKISALHDLTRTYEDNEESIYDPDVFATTKLRNRKSRPSYMESIGLIQKEAYGIGGGETDLLVANVYDKSIKKYDYKTSL